jgi:hypothetical protein
LWCSSVLGIGRLIAGEAKFSKKIFLVKNSFNLQKSDLELKNCCKKWLISLASPRSVRHPKICESGSDPIISWEFALECLIDHKLFV